VSALDTASIEQYSDAVLDMETAWDGMSTQMTVALAGPLTDLMTWLSKAPEGFRGLTMTIEDLTATFPRLAQALVSAGMPLGLGFLLPDIPAGARTAEEQVREQQLERVKRQEEQAAKEKADSEARARQAKANADRLAADKAEKEAKRVADAQAREAKRAADAQIREAERAAQQTQARVDSLTQSSLSEAEKYEAQLQSISGLEELHKWTGGEAGLPPEVAAKLQQKLQIEVQAKLDAAGKKVLDDYQAARDRESAFLPAIIKGSVESMKLQAKRDWEKRNPVAIWAEKNNKVGLKNNAELKQINQNLKALKPSAGGSGSGGGGGGGIQVNEVSF
jgi:flagellar biosynthesis GTPase FlhF